MSQIRDTISYLNKVLETLGFSKCRPEWFRLAKFNNDEVVSRSMFFK